MPRAQTIFVAQAGRKFRLFSLTLQRYKNFKSFPNLFAKKTREKARSRNWFTNLLHATVLQLKIMGYHSQKVFIFIHKYYIPDLFNDVELRFMLNLVIHFLHNSPPGGLIR